MCGSRLLIKSNTQLKCSKNGWELPSVCQECKNDFLMIKGAIGTARSQFPFAIENDDRVPGVG